MKPKYTHDCDACTFLGHWRGSDLEGNPVLDYDLYRCGTSTVIARYSSDGPDYISGLCFADSNSALGEAKRRAESHGTVFPNRG